MPQTSPQPIAKDFADQPGFTVNDLERPFVTVRNAEPAAVAFFFVNFNDLSFNHYAFRANRFNV
jgi:hypothetical protein